MVNITGMGIFAIMFLITLSLISFVGNFNNLLMKTNMARLNCQMPLANGQDYLNGTIWYNADNPANINHNLGTFYSCFYVANDPTQTLNIRADYKDYSGTAIGGVPVGFFNYIGDYIGTLVNKVSAMESIIGTVLNPASFTISGFTIADMNLFAQTFIFGVYIIMYIIIGVFIYKTVSPFAGD